MLRILATSSLIAVFIFGNPVNLRAAEAENPVAFSGEVAIRSTSFGYVVATRDGAGVSSNYFFRATEAVPVLEVRDPSGVLVSSESVLLVALPSQGLLLRLMQTPQEVPVRTLRGEQASQWMEDYINLARSAHQIGNEVRVKSGFELSRYAPAFDFLAVDTLLEGTKEELQTLLAGLPAWQTHRFDDLDWLFNDTPDNPGSGSCVSSTSSTCSISCLGGSSCSASCSNGRCATCKCDKDVPSCTCN